jgi:hypothetical protein
VGGGDVGGGGNVGKITTPGVGVGKKIGGRVGKMGAKVGKMVTIVAVGAFAGGSRITDPAVNSSVSRQLAVANSSGGISRAWASDSIVSPG